jgi:hypothetical protein
MAPKFGIIVADLDDLTDLAPEDRAHLRSVDAKVWSGMGMPLPAGQLLVLLNPSQTPERAASTIMEEVAHAHLGHQPSQLVTEANGMVRRLYDAAIEREAKWTAAAALLPAKAVARAVLDRQICGNAGRRVRGQRRTGRVPHQDLAPLVRVPRM